LLLDNKIFISHIFGNFVEGLFDLLYPIAGRFGARDIVLGGSISKAWPYFGPSI